METPGVTLNKRSKILRQKPRHWMYLSVNSLGCFISNY